MGKIHRIKSVQYLPADLDTAWKFFSDPNNLRIITPPSLHFKVTSALFDGEVYAGQVITYTVKPLLGIPLSWMTEISHVEQNKMFVDEQRKGPYKLWHHQHHFKAIKGGVEMTDLVHYRLPFSFLGELAHAPIVKPKLREIFDYRYARITERFGAWPEGRQNVMID